MDTGYRNFRSDIAVEKKICHKIFNYDKITVGLYVRPNARQSVISLCMNCY